MTLSSLPRFAALFALLALMIMLISAPAHAQTSRLYFAGYLGLNSYEGQDFEESSASTSGHIELDNANSFGAALGLRLSRNLRTELELSYSNVNNDRIVFNNGSDLELGGEISNWLGLINFYYDFDVDWKVQPFLSAGFGFGWHDVEFESGSPSIVNTSDSTTSFAWQLGGGMKYRIDPQMAFTGSYRFVDTLDLEVGTYEFDYGAHEFRIGLEYDLPVSGK